MLFNEMNDALEFYNGISNEAKIFFKNNRLLVKRNEGYGCKLYFAGHEDIVFTLDEIKDIDSMEKYNAFIERKMNKPVEVAPIQTPVSEPVNPTMTNEEMPNLAEQVDPIDRTTVDMLKTMTISPEPIQAEATPEVSEPVVVQEPNRLQPKAAPIMQNTTNITPRGYAKTYTQKRSGGFADVLILAIIVLIYVAIIVNLVIRLK